MLIFLIEDEPDPPAYPTPATDGDIVRVAAGQLSCRNDVGGTTDLKTLPACEVRVTKHFWDYEAGWRFHGQLLDPALIEMARAESTSGYTHEHYERTYPRASELHSHVRSAAADFDPSRVYFSEFSLERPCRRID